MGRVVSGSGQVMSGCRVKNHGPQGQVMSGCRVKNHGPHSTCHMCGSGLLRFRVFNYNFRVGSDWVGLFFEFG
jgi:hypothetical protein